MKKKKIIKKLKKIYANRTFKDITYFYCGLCLLLTLICDIIFYLDFNRIFIVPETIHDIALATISFIALLLILPFTLALNFLIYNFKNHGNFIVGLLPMLFVIITFFAGIPVYMVYF